MNGKGIKVIANYKKMRCGYTFAYDFPHPSVYASSEKEFKKAMREVRCGLKTDLNIYKEGGYGIPVPVRLSFVERRTVR